MTKSLLLIAGILASGCGAEYGSEQEALEASDQAEESLFVNTVVLRIPDRNHNITSIRVCFEGTASEYAAQQRQRELVEEAIEGSWDAVSWVDFYGWGSCNDGGGSDLHVNLNLTGGVGGYDGTVHLMKDPPSYNGLSVEHTLQLTALHEFGHALAFHHAHARPDWENCPDTNIGREPNVVGIAVGDVDEEHQSVVSYCLQQADSFRNSPTHLPPIDIDGIRRLYGSTGYHIRFGQYYGIRSQNKRFLDLTGGGIVLINQLNTGVPLQIFRFERAIGTPANKSKVDYNDFVYIRHFPRNEVLCTQFGGVRGYGGNDAAHMNANCRWKVSRTAGGIGGDVLEVNDPVRFRFEPNNAAAGGYITLSNDSHWRLLGSFDPAL